MDNGKKFTINVVLKSAGSIYIRSVKRKGTNYKLNTISYKALAKVGVMDVVLAADHN